MIGLGCQFGWKADNLTVVNWELTLGNIVITERSDGSDEENYLHKDHLGSTISVTDKSGAVVQQFTYDPWGKQTKIYQTSPLSSLVYFQPTTRGYTGHEMIDGLDIIHMNGRIYDANLGRFMQADPHIQSPGNFLNYNRYSYVLNNPLSMTDPSGYFFKKLFKAIAKIPILNAVVSVVLAIYCQICYVAYSAMSTYAITGSLRSAVIAGVAAAIGGGGGEGFTGFLASGAIGGVTQVLQGGKFGRGFMSAGIGNALGNAMSGIKSNWGKVLSSAVVGGTVSKISGGKFANGAFSSAFATVLRLDWGSKGESKIRVKGSQEGGKESSAKSVPESRILTNDDYDFIPEEGYNTPEEAATAGLQLAKELGLNSAEYGGGILKVGNGHFFTEPVTQGEGYSFNADIVVPKGADLVATFHTHPKGLLSNIFSADDVNYAEGSGYKSFIGIHSNKSIRYYDPSTMRPRTIDRTIRGVSKGKLLCSNCF